MNGFRWWLMCAGLVLSGVGCSEQPTATVVDQFAKAEEAFAAATTPEDYIQVAGTYQQMRDDGVMSAAVLFNQGNAFSRAEKHAHAIACYRQALRIDPANESIRANLNTAMAATGAVDQPVSWFRRTVFWHDWVGYESKFYLATIIVVLTSLVLLIARKCRSSLLAKFGVGLLVLSIVAVTSTVYDWHRFERSQAGVVVGQGVTPRTGNGETYEPAFNKPLAAGTEFTVAEQRGDWLQIVVGATGRGWVTSDDVVLFQSATAVVPNE